jgi:hypothetical protein
MNTDAEMDNPAIQAIKPFDKAQVIGMSGHMDNGLLYRMEIIAPIMSEAEREWLLEMVELFKRQIRRAPLSIHAAKESQ